MREIVNGIIYILPTGCQWRALPKDHEYLDLFIYERTLDRIHHALCRCA